MFNILEKFEGDSRTPFYTILVSTEGGLEGFFAVLFIIISQYYVPKYKLPPNIRTMQHQKQFPGMMVGNGRKEKISTPHQKKHKKNM